MPRCRARDILGKLKSLSNPKNVEGMARFGINPRNTLGVPIPVLRKIAKETGKDHAVAQILWSSGIHEARILAGMVDDPALVTPRQMDLWAGGFDSWDTCDQVCSNLFSYTDAAHKKTFEWSGRKKEFVKRAGFALMAALAVHDKESKDAVFLKYLPVIKRECRDGRNYVRKAVNWALRQIGKRNARLKKAALKAAKEIYNIDSKAARWIASDAIRELEKR
ncbi:MAG TPA: DNA alkylation repair protein [Candidatus Omnitrophota bacterium]|nr:DNA alkylation repair protein [Candidatus Omnitrophota bacterium]MDD5738180.1 DNA alkylation repair protein [Candidatus Omnitrophota bacterium]HOX09915.1 DNA alkylation repair protein [Candidatus Omnitrophota bacterium]HPN66244.1 DNA alkylation repair protein [Candidatus Omnitrophota bacterium]HRZ67435.1 DNA alkylation repair protein [Candidatus Omnitrophota bacterium]